MIVLYSVTLFFGAGLLFLVEPMMGKVLLPVLGGAPQVWITTQMFFQVALLVGYAYAHLIGGHLTPRRQEALHLALLALALVLLPIGVHPGGSDTPPDAINLTLFGPRMASTWNRPPLLASSLPATVMTKGAPPPGVLFHVRRIGAPHAGLVAYKSACSESSRGVDDAGED
jgi:hypothetical protein